ncbi:MAG TPA: S9 family peptidase, partial [Methylocella sp.]|nr:S9 family peptidase [Methylocella sp.]
MNKPESCISPRPASPPAADVRPEVRTVHGAELSDEYAWLKAANWQEVLRNPDALPQAIRALIEAENRYAMAVLAPLDGLRAELVKEMRGRIRENDAEVPRKDGPWFYYSRYNFGG